MATKGDGDVLGSILRERIIAVLRFDSAEDCLRAAAAVAEGGITALEITLTTPGALEVIGELSARGDLLIGVGSVRSIDDVDAAADAGALFAASPLLDEAVVQQMRGRGLMAMPGALTPTEIDRAWLFGADLVKVFPMPRDGVAYLRAILGPMPEVRLAPSGGVSAETAGSFLDAGAAALNVGSWLTHDGGGVADPAVITERARALVAATSAR